MNALAWWGTLDGVGYHTMRVLVSVLWQSSVLLAAAALLALLLRRRRASARHAVWTVALLLVPLLPLLAWGASGIGTPQAEIPVMPTYSAAQVEFLTVPPAVGAPMPLGIAPAEVVPQSPQVVDEFSLTDYPWALALLAYAAGTAFLLSLVIVGRLRIRAWVRGGRAVADDRVLARFEEARKRSCLRQRLRIVESESVPTPMTVCMFRPVVLLPAGLTETLSDAELRSVAIHELAHVKRRDPLLLTLVSLTRAFLFFHPLVWLAARQVSNLAEAACDDAVLDAGGEPVSYARMLARLAEELPRRSVTTELAAGIMLSKGAFLRRVQAILSDRRDRIRRLTRWAFAATVLAAILSLGVALALPLGEKVSAAKPQEDLTAELARRPSGGGAETAEAEPAKEWKATLPNGVTVELLGVSYHPSEGQPWWNPDGAPLPRALFERISPPVKEGFRGHLFALHVDGPAPFRTHHEFVPRVQSSLGVPVVRDNVTLDDINMGICTRSFAADTDSVALRVAAAVGDRTFRWVEFRNVSLKPGHGTDVDVVVEETPVPATVPVPDKQLIRMDVEVYRGAGDAGELFSGQEEVVGDGETAKFFFGKRVSYTIPSAGEEDGTEETREQDVGHTIELTPSLKDLPPHSPDGSIVLKVTQRLSSIKGYVEATDVPILATEETQFTILVQDGKTKTFGVSSPDAKVPSYTVKMTVKIVPEAEAEEFKPEVPFSGPASAEGVDVWIDGERTGFRWGEPPGVTQREEFGPVIERVLSRGGRVGPGMLDLDTGRQLTGSDLASGVATGRPFVVGNVPSPLRRADFERLRGMGVDLVALDDPGDIPRHFGRGLVGIGLKLLVRFPEAWWDPPSWEKYEKELAAAERQYAADASRLLGGMPRLNEIPVALNVEPDSQRAVYVVRTGEGATAFLQILGFTEDPPGVNIRYKMVQTAAEATDAGAGRPARPEEFVTFVGQPGPRPSDARSPEQRGPHILMETKVSKVTEEGETVVAAPNILVVEGQTGYVSITKALDFVAGPSVSDEPGPEVRTAETGFWVEVTPRLQELAAGEARRTVALSLSLKARWVHGHLAGTEVPVIGAQEWRSNVVVQDGVPKTLTVVPTEPGAPNYKLEITARVLAEGQVVEGRPPVSYPSEKTSEELPEWDRKVYEHLNRRLSLEFSETLLADVVAFLQATTPVNYALIREDLPPDGAPVSLVIETTLKNALDQICDLTGMDWKVEGGLIKIGAPESLRDYEMRVYDVRDLLLSVGDRVPGRAGTVDVDMVRERATNLALLIKLACGEGTWMDLSTAGIIRVREGEAPPVPPPPPVSPRPMPRARVGAGGGFGGGGAGGFGRASGGFGFGGPAAPPPPAAAAAQPRGRIFLKPEDPGILVIVQTPKVHECIEALLHDMRATNEE